MVQKKITDLKNLSDEVLLKNTQQAAYDERAATTRLLHYLGEVQRRRLFAQSNCSSLFEFCVRLLCMSEPQAARRINAVRLLKEFPHIEEKINSGVLTLTAISSAQVFFKREAIKYRHFISDEEKIVILEKLEHQSTRQTARILLGHSLNPRETPQEHVRTLGHGLTEIKFTANQETLNNLNRLKEIWSTLIPGANYGEVIQKMADFCRAHVDPLLKSERARVRNQKRPKSPQPSIGELPLTPHSNSRQKMVPTPAPELANLPQPPQPPELPILTPNKSPEDLQLGKHKKRKRYIPAAVRHEVWIRDRGSCSYVDEETGKRCGSRHYLQMDHQIPFARGGQNRTDNLRLRCFTHNQLHAIQTFGLGILRYTRP